MALTDPRPTATDRRFFIAGGTLRHDAPSYVERQADIDLYEGLSRGEFCYILTSRQMGKSSLMVRTATRLRQEGVRVAALDLTAIGQNLTAEQWYEGLLDHLGRQLDREDELEQFWEEHAGLGPLQRWMTALREVVLPHVIRHPSSVIRHSLGVTPPASSVTDDASRMTNDASRLVIFLDEIDAVRSLPFSADEFFAAIRECYTRRAEDPELNRLTFCLLGVASPSDLIQDTRTTPFNIGRRIELADFSETEASPLAQGLGRDEPSGKPLLQRVLYWTGGHPYLTQRLCQAVVEGQGSRVEGQGRHPSRPLTLDPRPSTAIVDRLCEELFLSSSARERDDNLLFVRDRLLRNEVDRASLLDLYENVRAGKPVPPDDTNPLVELLRLSGIARLAGSRLVVRNRIYERVFDRQWVREHVPDAEMRRQRAAYRRGLFRATALLGVILAVVGSLAITAANQAHLAANQAHRARTATAREARQRQVAEEGRRSLRRYLYGAQMNLAQQAWEQGNVPRAQELLEAQRPRPGEEDLRGWEWRYLWRICRQGNALYTFRVNPVFWYAAGALAPDGKALAVATAGGSATLWDLTTRRKVATLKHSGVRCVAFSPDGQTLATGSVDGTVKLWDLPSRRLMATLKRHTMPIMTVAFSPDGKTLATGSGRGEKGDSPGDLILWDLRTRQAIATVAEYRTVIASLAFSPDGRTLAIGNTDGRLRLWDVRIRRTVATLQEQVGWVWAVAFSPDGKTLASNSQSNTVTLWDTVTRRQTGALSEHGGVVFGLAFSPDGRTLASGSSDRGVRLWDVATKRLRATLREHTGAVAFVAFAPDGKTLVSLSTTDNTVKLWRAAGERPTATVIPHPGGGIRLALSPDGKILATVTLTAGHAPSHRRMAKLWDVASRRVLATVPGWGSVAFSPDGKLLAVGGVDKTVRLWDVASATSKASEHARAVAALRGHTGTVESLAFSPDGRLLASGSHEDNTVKLWDVAARRLVATLQGHGGYGIGLAFSPDGKLLARGSGKLVKLWDVASRRDVATLRGHTHRVHGVAFSPDGKTLAAAGWIFDPSVRLWDVGTRREIGRLDTPWTYGLTFSPDGKTLVTGSVDLRVRVWDVVTRQVVTTLTGHTGPVSSPIKFSPDGSTLATPSHDSTVRLWRAPTLQEIDAPEGAPPPPSSR